MFISFSVGIISGILGCIFWVLTQYVLNFTDHFPYLIQYSFLIPIGVGGLSALFFYARSMQQGWIELLESYHFGVFHFSSLHWVVRAFITLVQAATFGVFGFEGAIIELEVATLSRLYHVNRLLVEQRKIFVISMLASSFGILFNSPLSGALMALELAAVLSTRVRVAAVISSLSAYGMASLIFTFVFPGFAPTFIKSQNNILSLLISGMHPLSFAGAQWWILVLAAIAVGISSYIMMILAMHMIVRGNFFYQQIFQKNYYLRFIVTGLVIGGCVALVPENFILPIRVWEQLGWLQYSSVSAFHLLLYIFVLFILASAGWGSIGLVSPSLTLGALLGYAIGNAISSVMAVPLAAAGAIAALSTFFKIPIAMSALSFEVALDSPLWIILLIANFSAFMCARIFESKAFHEKLLKGKGVDLVGGRISNVLARPRVKEVMYRNIQTIPENANFTALRAAVEVSPHNYIGVVSQSGTFIGILAYEKMPSRIKNALFSENFEEEKKLGSIKTLDLLLDVKDLMTVTKDTLLPEDSLEKALNLLEKNVCIPVVDEQEILRGLIFEDVIIGRYKREIAHSLQRNFHFSR